MSQKKEIQRCILIPVTVYVLLLCLFLPFSCTGKKRLKTGKEIVIAVRGGNEHYVQQKRIVEMFEKDNPGIRVTIAQFPNWNDYIGPLLTKIVGNMQIDIFVLSGQTEIMNFAQKGVIMDLSGENDEMKDLIYSQLWEQATVGGRLYAFPAWVNPVIMFYNTKLFGEAGLPCPDENMDMDRFYTAARKLTDKSKGRYGCMLHTSYGWIDYVLQQYGLQSVDYTVKKALLSSERYFKIIRDYIEMFSVFYAAPRTDEFMQIGKNEFFFLGKAAMLFAGPYFFSDLQKQEGLEWDISYYPKGSKRLVNLNSAFWAINAKTAYRNEAIRYIKYLDSKKIQNMMGKVNADMSALIELNEEKISVLKTPPAKNLLLNYFKYEKYNPVMIYNFNAYNPRITDLLSLMSMGQLAVNEGCRKINTILTEAIQNEQQ